jgi:DNA-binding cell septation regulator SpoVG
MSEEKKVVLPTITDLKVFPVTTASKVKANGTVTFNNAIECKFIVLGGTKGDYITWNGGKKYAKKDGTEGWDSPIFVSDKGFNDTLTQTVMAKLAAVSGGRKTATGGATAKAPQYDASMSSDDIPF